MRAQILHKLNRALLYYYGTTLDEWKEKMKVDLLDYSDAEITELIEQLIERNQIMLKGNKK